jgi:hypothetical protein
MRIADEEDLERHLRAREANNNALREMLRRLESTDIVGVGEVGENKLDQVGEVELEQAGEQARPGRRGRARAGRRGGE